MERITEAGSIFGHPAVTEAIAVAAIAVDEPGLDQVEVFSSRGPTRIFFPASELRQKPDLAGFDKVQVTGVGDFASPFSGTSAAAPHSAAVAALVLQANPASSPAQVKQALEQGAVDVELPGFDNRSGFGRLDAVRSVPVGNSCTSDAECDDGNACNGEETCDPQDECTPGTPLSCNDGDACNGTETCDPQAGCTSSNPVTCNDGNSCTTDACVSPAGTCSFAGAGGFAGADCELGRLAGEPLCNGEVTGKPANAFAAKVRKARNSVSKAGGASSDGKRRRLLKKAAKLLSAAAKKIRKLGSNGTVSPGCVSSVDQQVEANRQAISAL
jgi:hypothetical protein